MRIGVRNSRGASGGKAKLVRDGSPVEFGASRILADGRQHLNQKATLGKGDVLGLVIAISVAITCGLGVDLRSSLGSGLGGTLRLRGRDRTDHLKGRLLVTVIDKGHDNGS